MSKINILDKEIFNLIAAGEVVEKPASVVKELVENSIDAGADHIIIEIKNGGRYIRVSDNGCGIDKDDLPKAFMPHATSKIAKKEDLEKIGTLGFRGEALSSIAAVSKVTVLSKTINGDGNKISISGGEIIETIPQRRFVEPEQIASICEFLISDKAKTITGQSINVCAGLSLGF